MIRLTSEQKQVAVQCVTEDDRPIMGIVRAKKFNNAPEYNSEGIQERSRKTAERRAERYKRMAKSLVGD